jgi:hypothetical protein
VGAGESDLIFLLLFCLVLTGEEEDETIHSVRGKLFILSEQNQWKERGTGLLRLNRRKVDRTGARLGEPSHHFDSLGDIEVDPLFTSFLIKVMRKDAVYAVMLNVTLFRGMSCAIAQDPRYLRFSVLTPSGTIHYNLRVRFFLTLAQFFELNWAATNLPVSLWAQVGNAQAATDLLKAINDNIPHA